MRRMGRSPTRGERGVPLVVGQASVMAARPTGCDFLPHLSAHVQTFVSWTMGAVHHSRIGLAISAALAEYRRELIRERNHTGLNRPERAAGEAVASSH